MPRKFALLISALVGIALVLQQGYLDSKAAAQNPQPVFVDVSQQAGIVNNRAISIEMTAGIAWGDYDRDGWPDLYVTDSEGANTLYRNNADGTFSLSPLSEQVALPESYSNGAVFADFNNDGWLDLYVANWGQDNLFLNNGGQGFIDITADAGIDNDNNSKSASWGDFDNDGWLDLYVANWSCYPKCGRSMDGDIDRLYRNNGDGTFTDVTKFLGSGVNGAGFIASFHDFDNDGDLDIYLVNDSFINPIGNRLWRNDGPGCDGWCFTQIAAEAGANQKVFGMGLAIGDYDNDGWLDYYFSNVGPMTLLNNRGNGAFQNVAVESGTQAPEGIGWGAVFLDYDNDGWRDLYLAVSGTTNHRDIAANKLFRNLGDGTFEEVACHNEATDARMSISVASADYNQDGWVDLLVGNTDEGYRLYENRAAQASRANWIALELTGGGPVNRDAVGARAYITTPDGVTQMQDVISGASVAAGNELTLYFGLGQHKKADITIRWPDGVRQEFRNINANQRYGLAYPVSGISGLQVIERAPGRTPLSALAMTSWPTPRQMGVAASGSFMLFGLLTGLSGVRSGKKARELTISGASILLGAGILLVLFPIPLTTDQKISALMTQADARTPDAIATHSDALVKLGEALFWDPELSGNRDTSCATCHHPQLGTGDGLSLPIGTGGFGLGLERVRPENRRDFVPRNAPPVFNLGHAEWQTLFWDGRAFTRPDGSFHTPVSDRMLPGLDSILAAQAMFPVTSREEMRGLRGDVDIFGNPNELAAIVDYRPSEIWAALMTRLLAIPEYVTLFAAAYPDVPTEDLTFVQAANAMAAYQSTTFTFLDSPFDRYLAGDADALDEQQKQGAILFYGEAGCATCHAGPLLTDQQFHNILVPQVGPGKGRDQPFDLGLARETGNNCDRYKFRTPPLRNVSLTGPYMHNGAFWTLEDAVRHHFDPVDGLLAYDPTQLAPAALQAMCLDDPEVIDSILATKSESASEGVQLTEAEFDALMAFLHSLTSPSAIDLTDTIPTSVPSGLPVGGSLQIENSSVLGD
jgi:cytochrome c peroxidase